MAFGSKFTRESAEKESGEISTSTIWNFRDGSTVIRFLEDLNDWDEYWEHYDANAKKFFPCTGQRDSCPGCTQDLKASHKWLVNAYVVEVEDPKSKAGYVNLYKVPKSLMNKVMRHSDRVGTLLEHDFEIIREGKGMDTEYDLERGDKYEFDFDKYLPSIIDHEEALQAAYDAYVNAGVETHQVEDERPSRRAARVRPVEDDEEDKPRRRVRSAEEVEGRGKTKLKKADPEESDYAKASRDEIDPPSEPQEPESTDEAAGEDEVISEETLRKMNFDELADLSRRAGIAYPDTIDDASELADFLIQELGEE